MSDLLYIDVIVEMAFGDNYTVANSAKTWTDVSAYVLLVEGIGIEGGRDDELDVVQASTLRLVLANQDRRFEPFYASGAYYPDIKPMVPIRVRIERPTADAVPDGTTWEDVTGGTWTSHGADVTATLDIAGALFYGFVTDWKLSQADPYRAIVEIEAVDSLAAMARKEIGPTYRELVRNDGAFAHWPMYETSGRLFFDAIGSNHGTWVENVTIGATTTVGPGASPLCVDAVDGLGKFRSWSGLDISGDLTIEWFMDLDAVVNNRYIMASGTSAAGVLGPNAFIVDINVAGAGADPALRFSSADGSAAMIWYCYPSSFDGHFFIVRDASAQTVRFYRGDGTGPGTVEEIPGGLIGSWVTPPHDDDYFFLLFTDITGGGGAGPDGRFNNLSISTVALDPAQIEAHAAAPFDRFPEELTSARIARVLDGMSWPTADRDLDTGLSTLPATAVVTGQSALAYLRTAESSEGGQLWQSPSGDFTFRNRHARSTALASAIVADFGGSDLPVSLPVLVDSFTTIFNIVSTAHAGGSRVTVEDTTSEDTFFAVSLVPPPAPVRSAAQSSVGLASAEDAASRASFMLAKYKDHRIRVPEMTVYPLHPDGPAAALVPAVVEDIIFGAPVGLTHQPVGGGAALTFTLFVERIAHQINSEGWTVTYGLSPAELSEVWIIEDPVYGVLDTYPLSY